MKEILIGLALLTVGTGTATGGLVRYYQTEEAIDSKVDLRYRPQSTGEMMVESRSNLRILNGEAEIHDYEVVLAFTQNRLNRVTYRPQVERDFLTKRMKDWALGLSGVITYVIGGVVFVSHFFREQPNLVPSEAQTISC